MPGPANSIIVKNVPRSTNADVWDEWADEDEDDDFLSPEMRSGSKHWTRRPRRPSISAPSSTTSATRTP